MKTIYEQYPTRSNSPTGNYPEGIFKNETAAGLNNGTPLEAGWATNLEALMQKIRLEGHITPNSIIETVPACQTWEALKSIMSPTAPPQATPEQICAGLPEQDWSDPTATINSVDTGDVIYDSCVGYNHESGRYFLWVLHDDMSIHIVSGCGDYSAAPAVSAAVSFNWSVTPDEILAIASDADFLFVAWRQTAGPLYISKFRVASWDGNIV